MRMLEFLKNRSRQNYEVGEFAHANENLIIIAMDPKDDSIFVAYNNRFVGGRIKNADGKKAHIVKDLLKHSLFDSTVDGVLMSLMDTFKIRRLTAGVNNVMQFLDGALYKIAQSHRKNTKSAGVPDGAVKSPLSVTDVVDPLRKN